MHHHVNAVDDALVRVLFLVLMGIATTIHVTVPAVRQVSKRTTPAWGHALMGVGMACMLLPHGWQPVPLAGWEIAFSVAGAASMLAAGRAWWLGDRLAVLHHADLVVGAAAMVVMVVDGRAGEAPVLMTGPLGAYFAIQAFLAGALVLWRLTVIDVPDALWVSNSIGPQPPSRLASGRTSVSVPVSVMAARAMVAAAMVYMLAAH